MRRLVLGTRNPGKVRELRALLEGAGWRIEGLSPEMPECPETGETFGENARAKALFYAATTGLPTLADDSGLVVDALDGAPGVGSARFVGPDVPQERRNREVLARLGDRPDDERTARFVCHAALAHRGAIVHETHGACEGRIAREPRGDGGFGYDPIFVADDLGRTFAELDRDEKSALSHRGAAITSMAEFLADWHPPGESDGD